MHTRLKESPCSNGTPADASARLTQITYRHLFIHEIFPLVKSFRYAVLTPFGHCLNSLGSHSELQLVVDRAELKDWCALFRVSLHIDQIRIREKSDQTLADLRLRDGSHLRIYLIHHFRSRDLVFIEAEELLQQQYLNGVGIRVVPESSALEFMYLWHCLNNKQLSAQQQTFLKQFSAAELAETLGRRMWALNKLSLDKPALIRAQLTAALRSYPANRGLARLRNWVQYGQDRLGMPRFLFQLRRV